MHISIFINNLTLEEIISLYYSVADKDSFKDVLQNHKNPFIKNINFKGSKEWAELLLNKSYYSHKNKKRDPFDVVAETIAEDIFKESRILKLLRRLKLKLNKS